MVRSRVVQGDGYGDHGRSGELEGAPAGGSRLPFQVCTCFRALGALLGGDHTIQGWTVVCVCADLHFEECEEVLWVMLSLSSVWIALQDSWKGSSVAWEVLLHLHPVCEDDDKSIISASASSPGKPRKFSIYLRLGFGTSKCQDSILRSLDFKGFDQ